MRCYPAINTYIHAYHLFVRVKGKMEIISADLYILERIHHRAYKMQTSIYTHTHTYGHVKVVT